MNVHNLRSFLGSLVDPLQAAGGTRVAGELQSAMQLLEPFDSLLLSEFSVLLQQSQEYRSTGILPVAASTTRKAKAPKAPAAPKPTSEETIRNASQQILRLYERSIDQDCDYSLIEAEIKKLDKQLTKDECLAVIREVGLHGKFKTKKEGVEGIKIWIFNRKETYDKTQFR